MADQTGKRRHYVFTWNNYTGDNILALTALGATPSCTYLAYQPERGENGTRHLQGVISFANPRAFRSVCQLFAGWHIESMRGTMQQAVDYCSKEDTRDLEADFGFTEQGERPLAAGTTGGRSDLYAVAQLVSEGKRPAEVAAEFPEQWIKFHRGITSLISLRGTARDFKTEVFWYYGSTGSGKTRTASDSNPDAYWKNPGHKWWDGYEGNEAVIIDDYRADFCKFSELLRLCDRYPYQIEYKGGTVQFISRKIYITTPKSPAETWASRTDEDLAQLMRRLTEVKHFAVLAVNDNT
jgi:hypothetical protein